MTLLAQTARVGNISLMAWPLPHELLQYWPAVLVITPCLKAGTLFNVQNIFTVARPAQISRDNFSSLPAWCRTGSGGGTLTNNALPRADHEPLECEESQFWLWPWRGRDMSTRYSFPVWPFFVVALHLFSTSFPHLAIFCIQPLIWTPSYPGWT